MKKYIKLIVSVLTIVFILATGVNTAFAGEFKQTTLDGVVLVVTYGLQDEKGEPISPYGTGFFVGKSDEKPQYILTNCHVIEKFLLAGGSAGPGKLQVQYDKDTLEEAYVVTYNAEKDIALLKLAKPTDKRSALSLKPVDEANVGSSVFAVGYPSTAEETVNAVDYYGKTDATVTGGRISRLVTEAGSGRQLLQMDVSINHGNSGGPLVDENGYVVGINTLGSSLDPNLNYAVSIEEAIPMLKNNNIPFVIGGASDFNLYLIPIIGGTGALLVIIIVLIVVLNKGKNKKVIPQPVNVNMAPMEPSAPMKKLMPIIHSMSTQHGGLTASVAAQPVLIGRDSAVCRIIFKEGTPGVSSKHCQIYYDEMNKTFVLTDLKSSYGTFLSSGQKLTPNVPYPLRPKDSFYLGEKDNLIYVDLE